MKPDGFFCRFICDYLAKHPDGRHLIELTENPPVLRFNDIDRASDIYCDYKEKIGTKLNRDSKRKKDNFKNILKLSFLKNVGSGITYGKTFLMYEVEDRAVWNLLKSNYSSQRTSHTVIRTFTKKILLSLSKLFLKLEIIYTRFFKPSQRVTSISQ